MINNMPIARYIFIRVYNLQKSKFPRQKINIVFAVIYSLYFYRQHALLQGNYYSSVEAKFVIIIDTTHK